MTTPFETFRQHVFDILAMARALPDNEMLRKRAEQAKEDLAKEERRQERLQDSSQTAAESDDRA